MAQAVILDVADNLEHKIRAWLISHETGGRFDLPFGAIDLTIPLMMAVFEEEGWYVEFDYDDDVDWLIFTKQNTKYLTHQDSFVD